MAGKESQERDDPHSSTLADPTTFWSVDLLMSQGNENQKHFYKLSSKSVCCNFQTGSQVAAPCCLPILGNFQVGQLVWSVSLPPLFLRE